MKLKFDDLGNGFFEVNKKETLMGYVSEDGYQPCDSYEELLTTEELTQVITFMEKKKESQ